MQTNPITNMIIVGGALTLGGLAVKKIFWDNSSSSNKNNDHLRKRHRDLQCEQDSLINAKIPNINNQTAYNHKDNMINPKYYQVEDDKNSKI